MTTAAVIRLRTIDLPAHTVLDLLQRTAGDGVPPFSLERRVAWVIRWRDPDASARARITHPGILHNPNKESLTVLTSWDAPLVPSGPADAIVMVWSRDRVGRLELEAALGGSTDALDDAERVTLWWLRATGSAAPADALRAFAREVAMVRDRRHGLLIHPHMAMGVVLSGAPTLGEITRSLWPHTEEVEAMTQ